MHEVVTSGWDTALIMAPFFGIMALSFFGVDEKLAATRRGKRSRRVFCQPDVPGRVSGFDPDGEEWR